MTHTLHRKGKKESLAIDFPLHATPAVGFNHVGIAEKLKKFWDIAHKQTPVNSGDSKRGNQMDFDIDYLRSGLTSTTHIVYDNEESLTNMLSDLKEAELGVSVTLSGLMDNLFTCCEHAHVKPFAIEHSLGILGDTDALPDEKILEMTTMCGHAMVSRGLVGILVRQIKKGQITPEQAGIEISRPCQCGLFNPVRAAQLLEEFCAQYSVEPF